MHLAIWNLPPAEFIVSGFTSGAVTSPVEIERRPASECARLLESGQVDVALLPTLAVLRHAGAYDALPAVALSTWGYPYARLVFRHGLDRPVRTVAFDPRDAQEVLVARIVLREHYGAQPAFVPYPAPSRDVLLEADEDVSLITGPGVPTLRTDRLTMDLGQEWYELANYPMVWGLFATRKGEATPDMIRALRASAKAADAQRRIWVRARETSADVHAFYMEDLRVRLDDLAVASLTELRQYLFYDDVLDDVPDIPFVAITDDEEEGGEQPML